MTVQHDAFGFVGDYNATQNIDRGVLSRYAEGVKSLGFTAFGRSKPSDRNHAAEIFEALTRFAPQYCDNWVGLAVCRGLNSTIAENLYATRDNYGMLQQAVSIPPGALAFPYDTHHYITLDVTSASDIPLVHAADLIGNKQYQQAYDVIQSIPNSNKDIAPVWAAVSLFYKTERWAELVQIIRPIIPRINKEAYPELWQITQVTLGIALAKLGFFSAAIEALEHSPGPNVQAYVDGTVALALSYRAQEDYKTSMDLLQRIYVEQPENATVKTAIEDPTFGIVTTTAECIQARSDIWDPATEPAEAELKSGSVKQRRQELLKAAEDELDLFIGIHEVKEQVARLKSSVAVNALRQERGLSITKSTRHLIFAGPPGTGKTSIARVVAKIFCGLGLLAKETVTEVTRVDLVGQHIGETEVKTNAVIDNALDGVLFIDEAYSLVSTGAQNDFGLVAIDTLLARMENDRDRLAVIIAGYKVDLQRFLNANEGLRSRFTRNIDFYSYKPVELLEMATKLVSRRDGVIEEEAQKIMLDVFAFLTNNTLTVEGEEFPRSAIDVAGNGRFVRNLVERSEEEREFRIHNKNIEDISREDLITITAQDARAASTALLEGLGVTVE